MVVLLYGALLLPNPTTNSNNKYLVPVLHLASNMGCPNQVAIHILNNQESWEALLKINPCLNNNSKAK